MGKIKLLPKWILPDTIPSVYDTTSGTAIEMVAKVYGAMRNLQTEYNSFIDEINETITDYMNSTNKDYEEFKNKITKIMHDYIMKIDEKIKMQDLTITNKFATQDDIIDTQTNTLNEAITNQNTYLESSIQEQFAQIQDSIGYIASNLENYITENVGPILNGLIENGRLDNEILEVFNDINTDIETINNNLTGLSNSLSELGNTLTGKQDVLTPGDNISIENNVISAVIPESSGGGSATETSYDNTDSNLESTNVQGAIDELDIRTIILDVSDTTNDNNTLSQRIIELMKEGISPTLRYIYQTVDDGSSFTPQASQGARFYLTKDQYTPTTTQITFTSTDRTYKIVDKTISGVKSSYQVYEIYYFIIHLQNGEFSSYEHKICEGSGGVSQFLSKNNTLAYTPTHNNNPATKKYVDEKSTSDLEYVANNYFSRPHYQIIEGTITCDPTTESYSATVDYPEYFTKDNCAPIAFGVGGQSTLLGYNGLNYTTSFTTDNKAYLSGGMGRDLILNEDNILIKLDLTNDIVTETVQLPYKLVLFKFM